jgi:3-dehydroquinate synthase
MGDRAIVRRALPMLRRLHELPAGTKMLWASAPGGEYPVLVGRGLLDCGWWPLESRRFVVSDRSVGPLYKERLAPVAASYEIEAGETAKTLANTEKALRALTREGMTREDHVVALGGGVVGDLAGFVAATFMRGVPVVQCPTSLLAMIDASVGGKTGVDTPAGKNLVGAFHQPAAVLVDVETLRTLPVAHRRAGLAEAIKHGVVADADYFDRIRAAMPELLEGNAERMLDLVTRSVELKAAVVRDDAREHGRRKTLNFGHTLGHAVEVVSGFSLLHGQAVAIGMVLEARLAERLGVAARGTSDEIERVVRAAGLPAVRPPMLDPDAILAATRHDKKARGGSVAYALPARIGVMAGQDTGWAIDVDDALVREVLG